MKIRFVDYRETKKNLYTITVKCNEGTSDYFEQTFKGIKGNTQEEAMNNVIKLIKDTK